MSLFPRVIPVLLVSDGYLVKPIKFSGDKYIGDPINAVRIFNEKQVDELVICDIDASVKGTGVNYTMIKNILQAGLDYLLEYNVMRVESYSSNTSTITFLSGNNNLQFISQLLLRSLLNSSIARLYKSVFSSRERLR